MCPVWTSTNKLLRLKTGGEAFTGWVAGWLAGWLAEYLDDCGLVGFLSRWVEECCMGVWLDYAS